MSKARVKKPTVMRNLVDVPQLEQENTPVVEQEKAVETPVPVPVPIPKNPFANATKMVRQPDVQLAVDPVLAQIIRDYEAENELLQKQFAENTRAKNKAVAKVLSMNALSLRVNCQPKWISGTDILSVPVPDVVAPINIEPTQKAE